MNPLFTHLFDDAAIFPPFSAELPDAVAAHRARLESGLAPLLGPFVCSADRLGAITGPPVRVSVVLPAADTPVTSNPSVTVVAIEAPDAAPTYSEVPCYSEIACAEIDAVRLAALRAAGLRLKLRTGGVRGEMFPSENLLARALWTAVRSGVAFKLTAGLHDPIRHRDPVTGFEHHGFLNVLLATARALQGYDIERTLADQDGERVAAGVAGIDDVLAKAVRHHFISFGTCSISEPVDGLLRYRLLPEDPR
ncbi:hypothetical protein [Actinoplanes derwentensis]|uniref:Uncharacterized protein n=1 Tax=Actinoplanes derwentensis TaxID=113562 RepID=A0A1H1T2D5_9ACTN|nr:hypothetical protein [Actinoplanes derwentensis]GID89915.1 hypothetical protein Ade03nite_88390 [Actinoplanes derwentensis]SDS54308.1 hypothetical protein SAMN04489716_1017 [Actinoplanes derwentensis]